MTLSHMRAPLVLLAVFVPLLGVAIPNLSRLIVRNGLEMQIRDSRILDGDGHVLASSFTNPHDGDPAYVWGPLYDPDCATRPDADCRQRLAARARQLGPGAPPELTRFTGSHLAPAISTHAADFQAARIAKTRHMPETIIRADIAEAAYNPMRSLTGRPSVNLLKLNLLLDGRSS